MILFNKVRLKLTRIFNELIICRIISILPLRIENKIVFDNFLGKGYGENPKYIADEIIREGLPYKLVWLVNDMKEDMPKQIYKVKYGSVKALYEMATARVWIDNVRNAVRPTKKRNQVFLQTWHGAYGHKPVEKEAKQFLAPQYVRKAIKDGAEIDGILSSNGFLSEVYRTSFWLNDKAEILEYGSPSYEELFKYISNECKQQELKIQKGLGGKYIVVYAPTFRDDGNVNAYDMDCERIWNTFQKKYGDCVLIIRLHPNVTDTKIKFHYNDHIIDGKQYTTFIELACIGDAVISDYSSTLYDFAIVGKPAYIYASDVDLYYKNRGSADSFYNSPFDKAKNNDELESIILNFNIIDYKKKISQYFAKYPLYGPNGASQKCVDWLKRRIDNSAVACSDCRSTDVHKG